MIFIVFMVLLLMGTLQKLWKMREILILSQKLKGKHLALPIVGHAYMFVGTAEDRMNVIQKFGCEAIKSKHGAVSVWLGSYYFAYICDPIVAEVASKVSLEKSVMRKFSRHLLGNGLFFAPVHIWRPRRIILAPTFALKNLNYFIVTIAEQSMIMTSRLKSRAGNGTFSLWKTMNLFTMDSVCQSVLGVKTNVQTQTFHPFLDAYDKYFRISTSRIVRPWLHWDFLYTLMPVYQEAERCRKILHDFVDDIIKKKRNITTESSPNTQNIACVTFLDLLLASPGGSKYTDVEIREELLSLVLAATDTSTIGTSFTILMLSRYLSVQEKIYEEIRLIFGDSKRLVTPEDLPRLKYTEAVIKETLRLFPPVPLIIRENVHDVKLNSDITLPTGSCTAICIWGIHRNPKYWGADAEEFNPDRFLNGRVTPASAYMPFGYGPRNCLGYKFAKMSMKVAVVTLLREYKVLPPSDMSAEDLRRPLRLEYSIMMKDGDNFNVRLDHRN